MILCDLIPRFKHYEEVASILWLLFHLFGIAANLYAYYMLKKRWNSLGNFPILLASSILSNISALFVHLYLPMNFLLRNLTEKEWSLGKFGCSFLPAFTNLTQAISLAALVAVAFQKYIKTAKQRDITSSEAENSMVLMFVLASLIVAPEFCQCGAVKEPLTTEGLCIPTWQLSYAGNLYQNLRVLFQYIVPLAFATNAFFKAQIAPRKMTCIYRVLFIVVDCISGEEEFNVQGYGVFPNIAAMMKTMDFVAIFCCIAVPFELVEIMNDVKMADHRHQYQVEYSEKPEKNYTEKLQKYSYGKGFDEMKVSAKVVIMLKQEKESKEELIKRLVNDEPLKLKNEIIV
ncbi:hypothetical protein AC249_AIPGENE18580 [Exaiptasia diaphana]|nr:hypothetical protein AC249_AIPGENE18580 [Exaiptasia diaphana]